MPPRTTASWRMYGSTVRSARRWIIAKSNRPSSMSRASALLGGCASKVSSMFGCASKKRSSLERAQVVEEGHAFGRQRRPLARAAGEQREAELFLERLHLVADRGLRDTERFRAAAEAAGVAEAGEDFELAERERKIGQKLTPRYRFEDHI